MVRKPHMLEDQRRRTYFSLRVGVALIALVFPFLLWFGGLHAGFSLRGSMSHYYHSTFKYSNPDPLPCEAEKDPTIKVVPAIYLAGTMRDYFVGLLFAVGAILYINKGLTTKENIALNIAGLMAISVALNPMAWDCHNGPLVSRHGVCAFIFFFAIAYVCFFCSKDTAVFYPDKKQPRSYQIWYRILAWVMGLSPVAAYGFYLISWQRAYPFWAEFCGIYAFSAYWIVKTVEISEIHEVSDPKKELSTEPIGTQPNRAIRAVSRIKTRSIADLSFYRSEFLTFFNSKDSESRNA
jgi:hypothetical protein